MIDFIGLGGLGLAALGFSIIILNITNVLDAMGPSFGWGIASTLVGMVGFVIAVVTSEDTARGDFMKDCLMERRQYECTALWRGGQPKVVHSPTPIIIPR